MEILGYIWYNITLFKQISLEMHTNLNVVGFHMNDGVRKGTNANSAPKPNL